jgi:hypothetical protein
LGCALSLQSNQEFRANKYAMNLPKDMVLMMFLEVVCEYKVRKRKKCVSTRKNWKNFKFKLKMNLKFDNKRGGAAMAIVFREGCSAHNGRLSLAAPEVAMRSRRSAFTPRS